MGFVVTAALVTRYPAVTQPVRDGILGGLLAFTGLYVVIVVWRGSLPTSLRWVLAWSGGLVVLYLTSALYSPTPNVGALRPTVQLLLVLAWVLFVYGTDREKTSRFAAFVAVFSFLLAQGSLWAWAGFPHPFTEATVLSASLIPKNSFGAFTAAALFFVLAVSGTRSVKVAQAIGVGLSLTLLWASGSRSPQLAVLVAAAVYVVWPLLVRSRTGYHAVFFCWLIAGGAFVYYYINLSKSDTMARVAVQEFTGQGLYSGRELLWPIAIKYISERPLLGWGAGLDEGEVLLDAELGVAGTGSGTTNAHNLFLAVALKTGIIGLTLQLAMLYSIWLRFYSGRHDRTVRLAAASFMGICVHQLFETSLINTNLSIGALFWAIIAIGMRNSVAPPTLYRARDWRQVLRGQVVANS